MSVPLTIIASVPRFRSTCDDSSTTPAIDGWSRDAHHPDATLIAFGRTLYREHRVSSELWQSMMKHFGRQHTVQLMMIMGDYFRVGFMMNAVDQRLPADWKPLLPPLGR